MSLMGREGVYLVGGPLAGYRIAPTALPPGLAVQQVEMLDPHCLSQGAVKVHVYQIHAAARVGFYQGCRISEPPK